jgi:hypothetical protein
MSVYDNYTVPSDGPYAKLETGKTHRFRIQSEPISYISTFKKQDRLMFAWIVWDYESDAPKVLQASKSAFKAMQEVFKKNGDPDEYDIKITRKGDGFNTTYEVEGSPKKSKLIEKISQEDFEKIVDMDLEDLVNKGSGVSNIHWLRDEIEPKGPAPEADKSVTQDAAKKDDDDDWED